AMISCCPACHDPPPRQLPVHSSASTRLRQLRLVLLSLAVSKLDERFPAVLVVFNDDLVPPLMHLSLNRRPVMRSGLPVLVDHLAVQYDACPIILPNRKRIHAILKLVSPSPPHREPIARPTGEGRFLAPFVGNHIFFNLLGFSCKI